MDILKMTSMYQNNEDFRQYVDKYKKTHGIPFIEDVFKCIMVQNYAKYLIENKRTA